MSLPKCAGCEWLWFKAASDDVWAGVAHRIIDDVSDQCSRRFSCLHLSQRRSVWIFAVTH